MYVDYRIINEKEVEVINDKGEIIKIAGLNQGDIKSLILLSNKIEGLEDKLNYQTENVREIKDIRRKSKNIIEKNILAGGAFGYATLIGIIAGTPVFAVVFTGIGTAFVLTNALFENIKIQKCNILERKYTWSWSVSFEESKKLKKELSELMTEIKIEKLRSEKKEELVKAYNEGLVKAYNEGLKNEIDFSFDHEDVKTLKLK